MCATKICFWRHPVLWFKWKYHLLNMAAFYLDDKVMAEASARDIMLGMGVLIEKRNLLMCATKICFWRHPVLWFKWKYHLLKWRRFQKPSENHDEQLY